LGLNQPIVQIEINPYPLALNKTFEALDDSSEDTWRGRQAHGQGSKLEDLALKGEAKELAVPGMDEHIIIGVRKVERGYPIVLT
jgi:hypothetical protein